MTQKTCFNVFIYRVLFHIKIKYINEMFDNNLHAVIEHVNNKHL